MRKLLFAGSTLSYEDFLARFELSPVVVNRVDSIEDLRGYKDCWLIYGHGLQWLPQEKPVISYCFTHNIQVLSEFEFTQAYFSRNGVDN